MSSVKTLNSKAEVLGRGAALFMNINAAKGLYDVMKTNLGPKGTIKMLVGGAGGKMPAGPCSRAVEALEQGGNLWQRRRRRRAMCSVPTDFTDPLPLPSPAQTSS